MKLDDFLKRKKVRCVDDDGCNYLTIGKEYEVTMLSFMVHIIDDGYGEHSYQPRRFEPVIDQAETPLRNIELTPEFEASEPKFKVGDKVYYRAYADICVVSDVSDLGEVQIKGWMEDYYNSKYFCHATQENYERLQATFPGIEFEQPPKPLTGIELAKKLIAKGHNYLVVDTVIGIRVLTRLEGNTLIDSNNVRLDELDDITPLNDETGEPLTESILND